MKIKLRSAAELPEMPWLSLKAQCDMLEHVKALWQQISPHSCLQTINGNRA